MNKAIIIVTVWLLLASSALGEKHAAEPSINNPNSWTADFVLKNPAVYQTNPEMVIDRFPQEAKNYFSSSSNAASNPQAYGLLIGKYPEEILRYPASYETAISTDISVLNNNKDTFLAYAQSQGLILELDEFEIIGAFNRFSNGNFVTKGDSSLSFTIDQLKKLKADGNSNFNIESDGSLTFSREGEKYGIHGTMTLNEQGKVTLTKGSLQHPVFSEKIDIKEECVGCSIMLNADGTAQVKGKNFFLPNGEILIQGETVLHSPAHYTFLDGSSFSTPEKGSFSVKIDTDYFTDNIDHSGNEQSYIQSYFAITLDRVPEDVHKPVIFARRLIVVPREENSIEAVLSTDHAYTNLDLNSLQGKVNIVEETDTGSIVIQASHGEVLMQGNMENSALAAITNTEGNGNILQIKSYPGEKEVYSCPLSSGSSATVSAITGAVAVGSRCTVTVILSDKYNKQIVDVLGKDAKKVTELLTGNLEREFLRVAERKYGARVKDLRIRFVLPEELPEQVAAFVKSDVELRGGGTYQTPGVMYFNIEDIDPEFATFGRLFNNDEAEETFTHEYAHIIFNQGHPAITRDTRGVSEQEYTVLSNKIKAELGFTDESLNDKRNDDLFLLRATQEMEKIARSGGDKLRLEIEDLIQDGRRELAPTEDYTEWETYSTAHAGCYRAYMCSDPDEYIAEMAKFVRHKPELVAMSIQQGSRFYKSTPYLSSRQNYDPRFKEGLEIARKTEVITEQEYNKVISLSKQKKIPCNYCDKYVVY